MFLPRKKFTPDFSRIQALLRRETTDRPVPFEFLIDPKYARKFARVHRDAAPGTMDYFRMTIDAFRNLGYDYAVIYAWETDTLSFPLADHESKLSKSQNSTVMITDEKSFASYPWPDPGKGNYGLYETLLRELPGGMKLVGCSHGGVLENVTDIVGFERLCIQYLLEPGFTRMIFDEVGSRLLEYYRILSAFDAVGACMVNDDWGFRSQTMFPPEMMKEYVYPWTQRIVEAIHANGKPVIFHSCGNLKEIMDDVIDDLKMDGKHSFEDAIYPVEHAYEWWHDRIAIIGGIDVDFLCRETPEKIEKRAMHLLEQTFDRGGYALGSGNSIAHYVPEESFLAMRKALLKFEEKIL